MNNTTFPKQGAINQWPCQILIWIFLFSPIFLFAQPANDDACDAIALTLGNGCAGFPYTNVNATSQSNEPEGSCFFGSPSDLESVWFSFVAPASGRVSIRTQDGSGISQFRIQWTVFEVSDCGDFNTYTELFCITNTFEETFTVGNLSSGVTYYIQMDGAFGDEGAFCIDVSDCPPPANDQACNATPLTLGSDCTGFPYSNACALAEPNEPEGSCFFGSPSDLESVWFSFVAPASGRVSIRTQDGSGISQFRIQWTVYEVSDCGDFNTYTELFCITNDFKETFTVGNLTSGVTYYIQMDGGFGDEGAFCIDVSDCPPPANDQACNATPLTLGSTCSGFPYSNACALTDPNEPEGSCFFGLPSELESVWFSFVAPASGQIKISKEAAPGTFEFYIQYAVYEASNCGDFSTYTEVFCIVNTSQNNHVVGNLNPGDTYYIQADGTNANDITFCLEVSDCPSPTNDDVCNAIPLSFGASCSLYSNECALSQTNEPYPNCWFNDPLNERNTIWFTFVGPASGRVQITRGSGSIAYFNMNFALYSASDCADFNTFSEISCIGNNTEQNLTYDIPPGQTYYIQLDGENDDLGTFCIEIDDCPPPPNDDVCNALPLTLGEACSATYPVNCALAQAGEPIPSCWFSNPPTAHNTIWFSFVAPPSGRVLITRSSTGSLSFFDMNFALYSASNCADFNTFTELSCLGNNLTEEIIIDVIPGDTYYIQVDGENDDLGTICLSVEDCPAPANDDVCNAIDLPANADCVSNTFSNECALDQPNEIEGSCFDNFSINPFDFNSVWFKFTATADGAFINEDIAPAGTLDGQLQLALFEASTCGDINSFTELSCKDFNDPSIMQSGLTQGTTYYIQVDGRFDERGDFCLEIWAPELICPPTLTAQCDISEQPPYTDLAAFEAAGGSASSKNGIEASSFQLVSETSDGQTCPETVTRVYSIIDTKNYTSICTQLIIVDDTIDPVLSGAPTSTVINLTCGSEIPSAPTVTASDNCEGTLPVTFNESMTTTCTNQVVISRSWSAIDACGNVGDFVQTIHVNDQVKPVLSGVPTMMVLNLNCANEVPAAPTGVTASDNCDGSVSVTFTENTVSGTCPNQFTITRSWAASDVCGNLETFIQTIQVNDNTIPQITCPSDLTIDCSETPPLPYADFAAFEAAGGSATDTSCGLEVSSFQLASATGSEFACPGNIQRVYQISDGCNTGTCVQTISIEDLGECDGIDLTISDNPIPYEQYRASNTIQSDGTVETGTSVEMKANTSVTLDPNFEVKMGGILLIEIESCIDP